MEPTTVESKFRGAQGLSSPHSGSRWNRAIRCICAPTCLPASPPRTTPPTAAPLAGPWGVVERTAGQCRPPPCPPATHLPPPSPPFRQGSLPSAGPLWFGASMRTGRWGFGFKPVFSPIPMCRPPWRSHPPPAHHHATTHAASGTPIFESPRKGPDPGS